MNCKADGLKTLWSKIRSSEGIRERKQGGGIEVEGKKRRREGKKRWGLYERKEWREVERR